MGMQYRITAIIRTERTKHKIMIRPCNSSAAKAAGSVMRCVASTQYTKFDLFNGSDVHKTEKLHKKYHSDSAMQICGIISYTTIDFIRDSHAYIKNELIFSQRRKYVNRTQEE